jgi:nitrile hydratase
MTEANVHPEIGFPSIKIWSSDRPIYEPGDRVHVLRLEPIAHYRVPIYLRGTEGIIDRVIRPAFIDNEEEGFGRNAGHRGFYYRVAIPMAQIWAEYAGPTTDKLYIEIFETWLERA